jgi:hypothetical protein
MNGMGRFTSTLLQWRLPKKLRTVVERHCGTQRPDRDPKLRSPQEINNAFTFALRR